MLNFKQFLKESFDNVLQEDWWNHESKKYQHHFRKALQDVLDEHTKKEKLHDTMSEYHFKKSKSIKKK